MPLRELALMNLVRDQFNFYGLNIGIFRARHVTPLHKNFFGRVL